jgi:hypothetical protein
MVTLILGGHVSVPDRVKQLKIRKWSKTREFTDDEAVSAEYVLDNGPERVDAIWKSCFMYRVAGFLAKVDLGRRIVMRSFLREETSLELEDDPLATHNRQGPYG